MTTATIRESQQRYFETVSAFIAGLSDDEAREVSYALICARRETRDRLGIAPEQPGEDEAPILEAIGRLRDIVVDENNHRLAVIHNMQADLNGGHYPVVSIDGTEVGKWQAYCAPVFDGPECWEGPNRDTVEEAVEDARRHCPNVEPEVYPEVG